MADEPTSIPSTLAVLSFAKLENNDESELSEKAAIGYNCSIMSPFFRALEALLDAILPPRKSERVLRATSRDAFERLYRPLARGEAEGLIPYGDPRAMALIWELKYFGSREAAVLGGALVALHIEGLLGEELLERPLIIAVPLHPSRLKERGYNQAERLASSAAKRLNGAALYLPEGLVRSRATHRQTDLPRRKRLANVRGAFFAREPTAITGRACILIDDVLTTGATLKACAEALRSAGASAVFPVALAYAE